MSLHAHFLYFLAHTEVGALTVLREGRRNHAYVPGHGIGAGAGSGVTLGVGLEVRHQNRQMLAAALNASPELRAYLISVPDSVGLEAEQWVTDHPGPRLSPAQVQATYPFAAPGYARMARDRIMGTSASHRADVGVRLTENQYEALHPRILELLTDIAWNSAHIARGNQNAIAGALQSGSSLQNANHVTRTYRQLQQLRVFITGLASQGAEGRDKRLGWIDARMQELAPQIDPMDLPEPPSDFDI
jgi:hypothetical protein